MTGFELRAPQPQTKALPASYDSWVSPEGGDIATFHRSDAGFVLRFKNQADFLIDAATFAVIGVPANDEMVQVTQTLYQNAITPLIGNHLGGLFIHGSGVKIGAHAAAFLGPSRRGKSTLAGAFAKAGKPFLTEDVLALDRRDDRYFVLPSRAELRVFGDTADFLLGPSSEREEANTKQPLPAAESVPFYAEDLPLSCIFLLGKGEADGIEIRELGKAEALAQLIQHAFILDVEDKSRMRGHFDRIGTLSQSVRCCELDYPRRYEQLPAVIAAVTNTIE